MGDCTDFVSWLAAKREREGILEEVVENKNLKIKEFMESRYKEIVHNENVSADYDDLGAMDEFLDEENAYWMSLFSEEDIEESEFFALGSKSEMPDELINEILSLSDSLPDDLL